MTIQDLPDLQGAEEAFERARIKDAFWQDHFPRLLAKHRDSFVAVAEREVVAVDRDLYQLVDALRARGLDPTEVWIQFMTDDPDQVLP